MTKLATAIMICAAFAGGMLVSHSFPTVQAAGMNPASTGASPSQGWNLHIDAQKHFGDAHPDEIAHHWCKPVSDGVTECQIYASDNPDAQLVGIETIVSPSAYKSFPASEQAVWHYHKDEIPKVNATLPGMTPDQAKKVVDSISDTYGKIWIMYDPMATNNMPTGQPQVVVLK
jgi:Protein of unknown function (DUF1264)